MTDGTTRWIRLLVVLAASVAARPAIAALRADPAVAVVAASVGGTGAGAIVLHNDGPADVAVGRITVEPGCSAAVRASPLGGFTLAPGGTRSIAIACAAAPASMQRCGLRVRGDDDATLIELAAVCAYAGAASLAPSPPAIDFGAVAVGARASRTIALASGAAIARLFVETTDLAGNFTVAAPCNPDARACDAAIAAVPAGGATSVEIACTPRSAGAHTAALHIVTSAGTRLTAPIALGCTGAAATAPVLSVSPSPVDVGAVEVVGATASTIVHLGNAGTGTVRLLDVQVVDEGTGGAADWRITAGAPCEAAIPPACSLAAGRTVDLELAFDPSAIAVRDATLLVNYRDTADRSISIPLRGTGQGPTLELVGRQSTLDFGTLPLDIAGALTFQVANRGTRNLASGMVAIRPAGPPFTIAPGPGFAVTTAAPTTFTATCRPVIAGTFTSEIQLAAPDVASPPIAIEVRCTGDDATALTASPPAVLLGEVRTQARLERRVTIASAGGPLSITSAKLEDPSPALTVSGAPAPAPAVLTLEVEPVTDGSLANRIVVSPSAGPALSIAIAGDAVTAERDAPAAASLGTFCVAQPTTPRMLALSSTGTATITAMAPVLASSDSPFDLTLVAPLAYPAVLAPQQAALVAATPRRRAVAGIVTDDLVWTTDVADAPTAVTKLAATFVDNGGAIAPPALSFGDTPIHLDTRNAQQVILQNCDVSPLQLDRPQVPSPFSIDSPGPPSTLRPGETATFSVGFHPTRRGPISRTLVITSPQLRDVELTVALSGNGVTGSGFGDDGPTSDDLGRTSFYACGSCASHDPGALAVLAALAALLRPRRRARCALSDL